MNLRAVLRGVVTGGLLFALAGAQAGCGEESSGPVLQPDLAGKADVAGGVRQLGAVDFAKARVGTFSKDFQFDGYNFVVADGAKVKLEVTHTGTSSALDTTLFLYGPKTASGNYGSRIAQDDDAGWGKLSRLNDVSLPKGQYLAVVGTKDGSGRGGYRLQLSCLSGVCGGETLKLNTVTLPTDLADLVKTAQDGCDPCGISVDYFSYSYSGTANLTQVVRTIRPKLPLQSEWTDEGLQTESTVSSDLKDLGLEGLLDKLKTLVGSDKVEIESLTFEGTLDGLDTFETERVLHFPAQKKVITINSTFVSG
jgi:hypothetical protein